MKFRLKHLISNSLKTYRITCLSGSSLLCTKWYKDPGKKAERSGKHLVSIQHFPEAFPELSRNCPGAGTKKEQTFPLVLPGQLAWN